MSSNNPLALRPALTPAQAKRAAAKQYKLEMNQSIQEYSKMKPDDTYSIGEFLILNSYTMEELRKNVKDVDHYISVINQRQKYGLLTRLANSNISPSEVAAIKVLLEQLDQSEDVQDTSTGIKIELVSNVN